MMASAERDFASCCNRHEYPGNTKNLVLMVYVNIGLEHHAAIWPLSNSKLHGSAFLMVRLIFDVMLRAYRINRVATEQQLEEASHDQLKFPRMARCARKSKNAMATNLSR